MANSDKDISFGADLLPKETNVYDLGNSTYKWNGNFNTINGVKVGSSPKFTDTTYTLSSLGAAANNHTHNYAGSSSVGGAATSAKKLETSRTIALGAGAIGTATSFNGESNITIPVTGVKESYLTWGGKSLHDSVTPIGMSLSTEHSSNRLAFINGDALTFEYSSDGGTTWTDYNYSATIKSQVCTLSRYVPIGRPDSSTEYFINQSRTRITLAAQGYVYTSPKKMLVRMSSSAGCNMLVEYKTGQENATWQTFGTYPVSGFTGWNDIPLVLKTLGGGSTQYSNNWFLRLTFYPITKNTSYPKECNLVSIRLYGDNNWQEASSINKKGSMSGTGHLYSYDMAANASFPAQITASQFNGALNGNASTATSIGTAGGVSTSINRLSIGSSDPNDGDYYIAQYAGGGTNITTYHRRPHSALWNYIKGKISSVLGLTAANYGGKAATAGTADTARNVAWANTNHPTFATVATSGSYNDLSNKPTIPTIGTGASNAAAGNHNHDGAYLKSFTETDPTVPAWAKAATKPTYTASEVGAPKIWTGSCSTAAATVAKEVILDSAVDFPSTLTAGTRMAVTFTYSSTAASPTLTIKDRNGNVLSSNISTAYINRNGTTTAGGATTAYYGKWAPYETVIFTYNGTQWIYSPAVASACGGYYGHYGYSYRGYTSSATTAGTTAIPLLSKTVGTNSSTVYSNNNVYIQQGTATANTTDVVLHAPKVEVNDVVLEEKSELKITNSNLIDLSTAHSISSCTSKFDGYVTTSANPAWYSIQFTSIGYTLGSPKFELNYPESRYKKCIFKLSSDISDQIVFMGGGSSSSLNGDYRMRYNLNETLVSGKTYALCFTPSYSEPNANGNVTLTISNLGIYEVEIGDKGLAINASDSCITAKDVDSMVICEDNDSNNNFTSNLVFCNSAATDLEVIKSKYINKPITFYEYGAGWATTGTYTHSASGWHTVNLSGQQDPFNAYGVVVQSRQRNGIDYDTSISDVAGVKFLLPGSYEIKHTVTAASSDGNWAYLGAGIFDESGSTEIVSGWSDLGTRTTSAHVDYILTISEPTVIRFQEFYSCANGVKMTPGRFARVIITYLG